MASNKKYRNVTIPTLEELKKTSDNYNLQCTDVELLEYQEILKGSVDDYNFVANIDLPQNIPKVRDYKRPSDDENIHKAWYVKCNIKESTNGKLHGKRIAIKDNTAVAGLPMMNGSRVLEGYIPEYDATVVKRILNEGGEIVGKTTCEDLCCSGVSYLTTYGPVRNPINTEYSSGGSSSGSAVAVSLNEADMAIGGDQGGSIRIPASCCGIVGLKPTHGLVPYTGAVPIVPCIDHLGPMAKNVADCALLLEVIAGYDNGHDYRQRPFKVPEYTKLIYPHVQPTRKVKVAILQEGVNLCDQNVQHVFNKAIDWLKQSEDTELTIINIPDHNSSSKLCKPLIISGTLGTLINGCGCAREISGTQYPCLVEKMLEGYQKHAHELSETVKTLIFMGDHVQNHNGLYHHAKCTSLITYLSQEYNKVLNVYDVIIMPTIPKLTIKIPPENASITDKASLARSFNTNTLIFNVTGHPALSLNCGYEGNLPVGMMIVGKHCDEVGVLNVASIFEEVFNKKLSPV